MNFWLVLSDDADGADIVLRTELNERIFWVAALGSPLYNDFIKSQFGSLLRMLPTNSWAAVLFGSTTTGVVILKVVAPPLSSITCTWIYIWYDLEIGPWGNLVLKMPSSVEPTLVDESLFKLFAFWEIKKKYY